LTIQTHRKMADVWGNNDLLAAWLRVGVAGMEAYAARNADTFTVSGRRLCELAGCSGVGPAVLRLRCLVAAGLLELSCRGAAWELRIPNLAKKQGFTPSEFSPPNPKPKPIPKPNKKESRQAATPPPADWSLALSELLVELVTPVPGARIPQGARARWAREIEALAREAPELRANGTSPADKIEAAIRWAFGPENLGLEYEVVIRSGGALREKWPKLVNAARRARQSAPKTTQDRFEAAVARVAAREGER
jgi:hypothetical protein